MFNHNILYNIVVQGQKNKRYKFTCIIQYFLDVNIQITLS